MLHNAHCILHNPHSTSCQRNVTLWAFWIAKIMNMNQTVRETSQLEELEKVIMKRKSMKIKFPTQPAQPQHCSCVKCISWLGQAWWSAMKRLDPPRLPQKFRKRGQILRNNEPFCMTSQSGWFVPYVQEFVSMFKWHGLVLKKRNRPPITMEKNSMVYWVQRNKPPTLFEKRFM